MKRALIIATLLFTTTASAEQIIPIGTAGRVGAKYDIELRNTSELDAVMVTVEYYGDQPSVAMPEVRRLAPGERVILTDIIETIFKSGADTTGEIHVSGPPDLETRWRLHQNGSTGAWLPSISTVTKAAAVSGKRRRATCAGCLIDPPTLVKSGDATAFAGSYGVSGTATIVGRNTIRVSNFNHNGTAPGIDFRIGLSTTSRRNFRILRVTARQPFQNATFDLTLPATVDLNAFDTFTVWCFEFNVIIAEGKFTRP